MGKLVEEYGFWLLIIACFAVWMGTRKLERGLPEPSEMVSAVEEEPLQTETETKPFLVKTGDKPYYVNPLFAYEISGLVVSLHDSSSLFDISHKMWDDRLNICDLAILWGKNATSGIYQQAEFHNQDFTAWVHFDDSVEWGQFNQSQFSNNHILACDKAMVKKLKRIGIGDQVRIKGYLAEYSAPPNFHRGSSTTRGDRGGGACETIYVTEATILSSYNSGWRTLHTAAKWMTGVLLLVKAASWVAATYRWRKTLVSV